MHLRALVHMHNLLVSFDSELCIECTYLQLTVVVTVQMSQIYDGFLVPIPLGFHKKESE